MNNMNSSKR
jgi:hypothetical protein